MINKKFIVGFCLILFSYNNQAQTLFTYGKKQVSKTEFLKAYDKNPSPTEVDRKKALREYLDLYINFKLKVQAAYDDKMNTTSQFLYESNNFKKQIAENHINNEANINALIKEAFERSQKDIKVAQVFVEIKDGITVTEAEQIINDAYKKLEQGKNFEDVAIEFSNDEYTKKTKGNLGYITVFTLGYDFENQIYALQKGEYSKPYKSKYGYHIFKNITERPAAGKRKIAQILLAIPPDASAEQQLYYKKLADSIYNLATTGTNFESLVAQFSNDRFSAANKGIIDDIRVGQYSSNFEEPVFALHQPGEIGKPFLTEHGWHIVKLLEITPVGKDLNDAVTATYLTQQIEKSNRLAQSKKALVKKWMKLCGFKPATIDEKEFLIFTDSAKAGKGFTGLKKITPYTTLFSFTKQNIIAQDWAKFLPIAPEINPAYINLSVMDLYKEFQEISCTDYYKEHLEDFNPALKEQSKEFDEANLLFSAMDKFVWSKANEDTAGLKNYYLQHKAKYVWKPGISAIVITTTNKDLVNTLQEDLKNNLHNWRNIVTQYGNEVFADSSRYENEQLPVISTVKKEIGFVSEADKNNTDGSYTFLIVTQIHHQTEPRSFADARGIVISDYQQVLEKEWINLLRKKYPVVINETVWKTIQ